jgi:hypothetical protein
MTVPVPSRLRWRGGALAAVTLVALTVGCSDGPPLLDQADTEAAVEASVADTLAPEVATVTCPADVERSVGGRFSCTVGLVALGPVRVGVRQLDDDGRLEVEVLDAVLADAAVALQLEAELQRAFEREFEADCGDARYRVWSPSDTFVCRAEDGDGGRSVEVTVLDPAGTLSFEVLAPSS